VSLLDCMHKYLPKNRTPERFLKKTGLFDLLKMKTYQTQLSTILFPTALPGVPPRHEIHLSRLLKKAENWFKYDVLNGNFDREHHTNWYSIVNEVIFDIHGVRPVDYDLWNKIESRVVFWITFYSVLLLLSNNNIINNYCELK